jgi:hypothetical protein
MHNAAPDTNAIVVWKFSDAPEMFRNLSEHGGDEDWLAFVPSPLAQDWIGWMETGTPFGCCEVSRHPVSGGEVRIGAHS